MYKNIHSEWFIILKVSTHTFTHTHTHTHTCTWNKMSKFSASSVCLQEARTSQGINAGFGATLRPVGFGRTVLHCSQACLRKRWSKAEKGGDYEAGTHSEIQRGSCQRSRPLPLLRLRGCHGPQVLCRRLSVPLEHETHRHKHALEVCVLPTSPPLLWLADVLQKS